VYAIVAAGGGQEKVAVGDEFSVNRIQGEPGSAVDLPAVMIVNDGQVSAGTDASGAAVRAEIVEQFRGPKLRIMRYKNKTGYRRRQGHRQELTRLRVTEITPGS